MTYRESASFCGAALDRGSATAEIGVVSTSTISELGGESMDEARDALLDELFSFAEEQVKEALENTDPYTFEKWSKVIVLLLRHSEN